MKRDEHHGRATSFGGVAGAYERARPEYPADAVRWLTGDARADVVDLGAGTGKLTRGLVALGHRVTAVEPLPEMLEQLRAAVPKVVALSGGAEKIPLPDASTDVVVCAQAFHWFDQPVALREIARVLRPSGRIGLVWNKRDARESWMAALSELESTVLLPLVDAQEPIAASGLFGPVEGASFAFVQRVDREMLLDLVRSRSYCAIMDPEERDEVLGRFGSLYDANAGTDGLDLPYTTECFRAARL
ncbi:MAG: class I SAM-dependent methyltransferase [Gaiellaceae bacterium]